MFTGIINNLGKLQNRSGSKFIFQVAPAFCRKLKKGTSVSVNGVCLTVVEKAGKNFTAEIMPETANRSTLGNLRNGGLANLELPATPQSFLSGHIMQGHVDGRGVVRNIKQQGNSRLVSISVPKQLGRYVVEKGSIAVDGVSLTVISIKAGIFTVGIIPHTWKSTNFRHAKVGDLVNLEVDILAKYLEKMIKPKKI